MVTNNFIAVRLNYFMSRSTVCHSLGTLSIVQISTRQLSSALRHVGMHSLNFSVSIFVQKNKTRLQA